MSRAGSGRCAPGPVKRSNAPAEPKFRRAPPEARREELITATLACLRKYGSDGASVRRIGAEAGLSMGLINHHFKGIDGLLAAAFEELARRLLAQSRDAALATPADPVRCLHALFAASFTPEALEPSIFRIWIVFWSLVPHSREIRAVRERAARETRALLETLLSRLQRLPRVPAFRIGPAAVALSALMDGLWVELSLDPSSSAAAQAVALCDDWVHGLTVGAFPTLREPRRRTGSP
jgi:TetR/AcrR family transcriptional regulator, transcriptional repressor of bet genes